MLNVIQLHTHALIQGQVAPTVHLHRPGHARLDSQPLAMPVVVQLGDA